MKKKVKKLGLHSETLHNLSGDWTRNILGGALTQAVQTICNTCTHACSGCAPCA